MRDEIKNMLEKAERKLKSAKKLFEIGEYEDAVSRAYYAVFHAISAVLLSKGLTFSKHAQVIGAFNKEFIKTGVFPKDFTKILTRLYEDRQTGDYSYTEFPDEETTAQDIEDAQRVLSACKKYSLKLK